MGTLACMHADPAYTHTHTCTQTHKTIHRRSLPFSCGKHMQPYSLHHENRKNRKPHTFSSVLSKLRFYRQRHTHKHTPTDTWSTFQPKMMKYEMEHYRLEWQSAQDCAGPLSHCLLLPEKKRKKREGGGMEGKKQLTVKNNFDKLRFLILFFFYMETKRAFRCSRWLNLWFGNPHKPFKCMSSGKKANSHTRK